MVLLACGIRTYTGARHRQDTGRIMNASVPDSEAAEAPTWLYQDQDPGVGRGPEKSFTLETRDSTRQPEHSALRLVYGYGTTPRAVGRERSPTATCFHVAPRKDNSICEPGSTRICQDFMCEPSSHPGGVRAPSPKGVAGRRREAPVQP